MSAKKIIFIAGFLGDVSVWTPAVIIAAVVLIVVLILVVKRKKK